ncbi:MAG: hypothetical protein Q9221_004681 [Calogaya cf. arnoldii]
MPYPPSSPNLGSTFTATLRHDTYPAIDPAKNKPGCRGKSVLVTGAGKGLGRSIAISYAKAGASHIAITARSLPEASAVCAEAVDAAKSAGENEPQMLPLVMDVCDRGSLDIAASIIRNTWVRLDILVNNAAYLAPFVPVVDGDEEEWWRTWEVNVRGVCWVTKALLILMLKGGDKTVINLTSTGALALTPGASAYKPSKLAVMRLTEYFMVDYVDQISSRLSNLLDPVVDPMLARTYRNLIENFYGMGIVLLEIIGQARLGKSACLIVMLTTRLGLDAAPAEA